MAVNIKQHADGTTGLYNEQIGKSTLILGGATPVAGGSTVAYHGSSYLKIKCGSTPATSGLFSVVSPFGEDVIIGRTILNITAAGDSGTNHITIGTGTSSTVYGNNLIDHITCNATGAFDNITDKGTNGKSRQLWAAGTFITGTATITPVTFTGDVYVEILRP